MIFELPLEYDRLVLAVCPACEYEDRDEFVKYKNEHFAHEYLIPELAAE